jgi:hypothetical protein
MRGVLAGFGLSVAICSAIAQGAGDAAKGEVLFKQQCHIRHQVVTIAPTPLPSGFMPLGGVGVIAKSRAAIQGRDALKLQWFVEAGSV